MGGQAAKTGWSERGLAHRDQTLTEQLLLVNGDPRVRVLIVNVAGELELGVRCHAGPQPLLADAEDIGDPAAVPRAACGR